MHRLIKKTEIQLFYCVKGFPVNDICPKVIDNL